MRKKVAMLAFCLLKAVTAYQYFNLNTNSEELSIFGCLVEKCWLALTQKLS